MDEVPDIPRDDESVSESASGPAPGLGGDMEVIVTAPTPMVQSPTSASDKSSENKQQVKSSFSLFSRLELKTF